MADRRSKIARNYAVIDHRLTRQILFEIDFARFLTHPKVQGSGPLKRKNRTQRLGCALSARHSSCQWLFPSATTGKRTRHRKLYAERWSASNNCILSHFPRHISLVHILRGYAPALTHLRKLMANEERRMGPRKLAPKLPTNSSSASSGYNFESNPQSQSQSKEPQPNAIPTKPKRAQVRAACVACQRGKAKVSPTASDVVARVVT